MCEKHYQKGRGLPQIYSAQTMLGRFRILTEMGVNILKVNYPIESQACDAYEIILE